SMDHRADLYAFGCLAYELLCGETPFHARPVHQTFLAHVNETPAPISSRRPDCPAGLAQVVMQCLEKDPARRPQSAREVLQALDAVSTPLAATGVSTPSWLNSRLAIGGVALVLLAIVGTVVARRWRGDAASGGVRTLAVLPFLNIGGDSAQEYFADG